jgi:hypothetical protein
MCATNRPQALGPMSETNAAPTSNPALKQPEDLHGPAATRADEQPPVSAIREAPKLYANNHLGLAEPRPNSSRVCGQFACAAQLRSGDRQEFVLFRGHCDVVSKNWALRRIAIVDRFRLPSLGSGEWTALSVTPRPPTTVMPASLMRREPDRPPHRLTDP